VDIAAWLRGLGLGQYEQTFRDNAVDAEVLPKLTGDDLSPDSPDRLASGQTLALISAGRSGL
jgi:SAM domain (Sterile alpha motif)